MLHHLCNAFPNRLLFRWWQSNARLLDLLSLGLWLYLLANRLAAQAAAAIRVRLLCDLPRLDCVVFLSCLDPPVRSLARSRLEGGLRDRSSRFMRLSLSLKLLAQSSRSNLEVSAPWGHFKRTIQACCDTCPLLNSKSSGTSSVMRLGPLPPPSHLVVTPLLSITTRYFTLAALSAGSSLQIC